MEVDQKDAEVLSALANAGSDMRVPHALRHYFYTRKASTAVALRNRLRNHGYDVQATEDQQRDSCDEQLVLVTTIVIPTTNEIGRLRSEFERIAGELCAEYDGWEAPITKARS